MFTQMFANIPKQYRIQVEIGKVRLSSKDNTNIKQENYDVFEYFMDKKVDIRTFSHP